MNESSFFFFNSLETNPLLPCKNVITARFEVFTENSSQTSPSTCQSTRVLSQNIQNNWFIARIMLNTATHCAEN